MPQSPRANGMEPETGESGMCASRFAPLTRRNVSVPTGQVSWLLVVSAAHPAFPSLMMLWRLWDSDNVSQHARGRATHQLQ